MMKANDANRRRFLARLLSASGALLLAGCDRLDRSEWFRSVLALGERASLAAHRALIPRSAMAQEFTEADLSPGFRSNGTSNPANPEWQAMARAGFSNWMLAVDGMVAHPRQYSLAQLRALPSRTQITRHDCVEGWSAIGKWTGVPLARILEQVAPAKDARYVVFHCADPMEDDPASLYYESIDMEDAWHAQTILAYGLNGQPLPAKNGAPLRLRVERQLGYKHAKYLMRIELVDSLAHVRGGKGGYWEDSNGYQWYAGI
jgi:DMSO/TMAO reductase YedYZ molybdopterin-dependent catalytic subunit